MRALGMLLTLLPLLLQCDLTTGADDPIFFVAVTTQAVSGTTETLCAHVMEPSKTLSLVVTLSSEKQNLTILKEDSIKKNFYKCVPFQVPVVYSEYVANVSVTIRGRMTSLNKTIQILIIPPKKLLFIQTDKPIYKPGERVKFRIVSLNSNFSTHNQKDPNSNRISQWLNQSTWSGIVDLFHPTTPQAVQGHYTIAAWDEKNQEITQSFEIKEYVLPKFEVTINIPNIITTMDKQFTLQVCAKYTYGKVVQASVTAKVCKKTYEYVNYEAMARRPPVIIDFPQIHEICKNYNITLDRTGCGSQLIQVSDYGNKQGGYFEVQTKVEEVGTGITMEKMTTASYTSDYVLVSFVDSIETYRPGVVYMGKVLVSDIQGKPMKNQTVYLTASYGSKNMNMTLITDSNGRAQFFLKTRDWSNETVTLQAYHKEENNPKWSSLRYYQRGYLYLRPFYSKSKSFLTLVATPNALSCGTDADVEASYIIQGRALDNTRKTSILDFFYMVFSKGSMTQNGRISVAVRYGTENRGTIKFTLKETTALTPFAQVVVYTILPNGETVADSLDFPIEQCLPNKVSLSFSPSTAQPKDIATLNLKAQPGSLCSVRSIDQSVLLLRPQAELNADFVFGMLPVPMLRDYPYQVGAYEDYSCIDQPIGRENVEEPIPEGNVEVEIPVRGRPRREKRSRFFYPYYYNRNDAYSMFRAIGVKIATNSDVKEPVYCYYERLRPVAINFAAAGEVDGDAGLRLNFGGPGLGAGAGAGAGGGFAGPVQNTLRKNFPETWIWNLVPVGTSGSVKFNKTVPDTITNWATGAFCTSSVGFGVAPSTNLTAFLPFFVSLTLPYSVIRGETFTLKASVFNYLSKCIMVKVTLGSSRQYTALPCNGCKYTQCICSEESKTFQWTVTPTELGQINVTVRAEAVQSQESCGKEVVIVPEGRRIDTVVQSFLVEAEGTKQTITHNELICLTGNQTSKNVSLNLPEVFVKDSAKSFVTVLGDLMGSALRNIANLLQMPFGCGEQNMLNFAPNIYILKYLESTGQLTPEILARAKTFLESGYQRELAYKHYDGSYSAFGNTDPSGQTWLTAYVMKSFGGAKNYVFVDQTHIDQAKEWLGQQQQVNGCYKSVGILHHIDMQGGVSDEVTLTAYIVAALLELGVNKSDPMVEKGLVCLKNASSNLNNTYFAALLSYTATLAGDQVMRQNLISYLHSQARTGSSGVGRYWTLENNQGRTGSLEVEMSAYVLLALLSGPTLPGFGLDYVVSIVRWLTQQQNAYGGFSSTQDTVVALQALAKYSAATYSPEASVVVNVTSSSNQKYDFTVNQINRLVYQEKELQPPNGTFTLRAQGKGCVLVQFAMHYNVPPTAESSSFSILTNTTEACENNRKLQTFTLSFTVKYKGPREETNMVLIDVKLLSGFVLDDASLQALNEHPKIKRLEQNEGHIIIYLYGMHKKEEITFKLKLLQDVVVKDLKPAVVTVYDYYKKSEAVVSEYNVPEQCLESVIPN